MRKIITACMVAFFVSMAATWASQPGQPLDCTDWVFLEPGYSCSTQIFSGASPSVQPLILAKGANRVTDNAGRLFITNPSGAGGNAGVQVLRSEGQGTQLVAYLSGRTYGPGLYDART